MLRFLIIILLLAGPAASAQQKLLMVPEEMRLKPWLDREEHIIWNHSVMMIFGEGHKRYRHMNVGEFTSLAYQSPEEIAEQIHMMSREEGWDEEKLHQELQKYEDEAPGGRLYLYISRYTESEANTRWYFVIIRDEHDEKVTQIFLDYKAPEVPEGSGWWNFYEIRIDKPVSLPFYVNLNKNITSHLSDFKFQVSTPVAEE